MDFFGFEVPVVFDKTVLVKFKISNKKIQYL